MKERIFICSESGIKIEYEKRKFSGRNLSKQTIELKKRKKLLDEQYNKGEK